MASSSFSTELVNEEPERQSLQKPFIKTTKKSNYGSLRKEVQQTTTAFIVNYKHKLKPGETLQAISLRYGIPVENIKRANRLWSNDLAFIKEILLVPMSREKLIELKLDEIITETSDEDINNNNCTSTTNNLAISKNDDGNDRKFTDYLNKYDTFINESKIKLKSLETNPK